MKLFIKILSISMAFAMAAHAAEAPATAPSPAPATAAPAARGDVKNMQDEALALFFAYHTNMDNLNQAVAILEKAIALDPGNAESYRRIARISIAVGDMIDKGQEAKLKTFNRGRDFALKAVELDPGAWDSHFWVSALIGRVAQTRGILASLFLLGDIQKYMDKALELKPDAPLALDAKGVLYYELPWFKGGDLDKSEELLKKAYQVDPNFTLAHFDLAKTYMKAKKYDKAKAECEFVVGHKTPTYMMDWAMWDMPKCKAILKEIEGAGK